MARFASTLLFVAILTWSQGAGSQSTCRGADTRAAVEFARDVLPTLVENCYQCHGPDEQTRQADLRLDTRQGAYAALEGGRAVISPGDAEGSELFRRLTAADADQRMPPPDASRQPTASEVDAIRQWIEQGAPWRPHWALVAPQRPALPEVAGRLGHPIDRLVAARLQQQGLSLSPPADRYTLIRRLSLDLTGLPPTPEQVDAFVGDHSPDAYQQLVDRLLASPRYGERMAIQWLDAARYADTHGYLFDTERFMWRWRDWVIDALNANMPFDQFTVEQLAGDLLPEATHEQKLATGFHRNHLINNEAGAIPAEYLVENIVDRVNTTATVWMGLTLGCCQCHDHKYDPFTQRDYYRLYAFFNNVPETGLDGLNSNAKPLMPAPTPGIRDELAAVQRQRQQAVERLEQLEEQIAAAQAQWEKSLAAAQPKPLPDLAAHWPLDRSAADTVRPEQPAVFEAAPEAYGQGLLGAAAELDGLAYLNGGDRFNFQAQDALTLSAWIRPTTKAGRLTVLSRMRDGKGLFRGYALQLVNGLPAFFLVHEFPDSLMQVQAKTALEPDRWHHLAVTYDGTGKAAGVKLYVNGEPQTTGVVIDKLSGQVTTDQPLWIGNGHPAAKFKGRIDEVRVYRRALTAEQVKQLPGVSTQSLLAVAAAGRTAELQRRVREFYLTNHAPPQWREPHQAVASLSAKLKELNRGVPTVMVMQERKEPRETRILRRGAFDQPGDVVTAETPGVLPPLRSDWPRNRLGLARWLVDPQHPLTARVTVNRIWQLHFGQGLVKTSEDFGVQGERPSHPQLLDWLAVELVDSGWDIKALQRLIVTSAVYQQTSRVTPQLLRLDPENRLLARGPRHRLPAELIRDQALAASGLLSDVIGGPSVKPYQPPGLWREVAFDLSGANLTAQVYQQDSGENLYRRSLYTFWKRTAPPPTLQLLDAPDRERCQVRRERTNTPLQALALMNDPTFVEASRKLAERMMLEGGPEPARRISRGFHLAVGRPPRAEELRTLLQLLESQLARFADQGELAEQLLSVGESPRHKSLDGRQLAAYAIVANVILNLDETINKG